jgi:uncharacterized protein DUF3806
MNPKKDTEGWSRRERLLDYAEIAFLSKNALEYRGLMATYGVIEPSDQVTAEGLDVLFAKWLEDQSLHKMPESNLIAVLGITFGNYLCERLSMQWIEVTDEEGTTYATRHETAEVYCFPLEAVKRRVTSGEKGFFLRIEASIRDDLTKSSTKHRA